MSARTSILARLAMALAALVVTAALAMAPVSADTKKELANARADLEDLRDRIAAQQAEVSALQAEAGRIAASIDQVETRISRTQAKIVDKQEQLRDAEAELQATQEQLDRRAWVAYENGPGTSLEFILGATSLSDLTTRLEIVDRAAESDRGLIDEILALQERLRRRAVELQGLAKEHRAARKDLLAQNERLQSNLAAAQSVVASLDADIADAQGLVARLEDKAEEERLAALLAQKNGSIGGVFNVCPVGRPLGYGDSFGAPRIGHIHAGIDIFADYGTPIYAAFGGSAEKSESGLGGQAVKVFGGSGWVYNAHLSAYAGGFPRQVAAGELIGYVGDTGNAQGTPPHNHFEYHPNVIPPMDQLWESPYGYKVVGDAIDPFPFLNAVCL